MKRKTLFALVAAGAFLLSPVVVTFADESANNSNTSETYRYLNLFGDAFERVRADYVEEVSDKTLIENAISGMVGSLDPHSNFLDEKAYRDMQVQTRGEFGGLGIEVTMANGLVKVVSPIDDTPAAKAGIRPNDLIVGINGEPVMGLTLSEAVERMRGPVGSTIKLTIRRGENKPFDVSLTRAVVRIKSVKWKTLGDVGYIRITSFNEQTDDGVKNAIAKIDAKVHHPAGYILDLRNNPGGLLDQALAVSDDFLTQGEIVSTRSRRPEDAQRYNATPGDLLNGAKIVVLINSGSASASEIVAGALQDHKRATVMGVRSFGKGSVQTIIPLNGKVALRLTTARYYTPSGRSIQGVGITPNIIVHQQVIPSLEGADFKPLFSQREADLKGALTNDTIKKSQQEKIKAEEDRELDNPVVPPNPKEDFQLQMALNYLHGKPVLSQAKPAPTAEAKAEAKAAPKAKTAN